MAINTETHNQLWYWEGEIAERLGLREASV